MTKAKVLIMTRNLKVPGGVTNFYRIFFKNYKHEDIIIQHFKQGIKKEQNIFQTLPYILTYMYDIIKFIIVIILDPSIKIIHLNPSFFTVPIIRDIPYILISKLFSKKVMVFFHGWDYKFYFRLRKFKVIKNIVKNIFKLSDIIFVLSNDFKNSLLEMGCNNIEVTKTIFDGELYLEFNKNKIENNVTPLLLFVGRMQEEKGIMLILEALRLLEIKNLNYTMEFIGWFVEERTKAKFFDKILSYHLDRKVKYIGFCSNEEKLKKMNECDFFLYPSYYPEGCPTVIIEALGAACFIISTNVAALKEVIRNEENGYIVNFNDALDLSIKIEKALNNFNNIKKIRPNIKKDAFEKYESKIIINQIHERYIQLLRRDTY